MLTWIKRLWRRWRYRKLRRTLLAPCVRDQFIKEYTSVYERGHVPASPPPASGLYPFGWCPEVRVVPWSKGDNPPPPPPKIVEREPFGVRVEFHADE